MKLDIEILADVLRKDDLEVSLDLDTKQIQIVFEFANRDVPLFFSIISQGFVLQSIGYLPLEVPKKHMADLSRLLHILNKQFDIPGFGMDESMGLVFFRIAIPCPEQTFTQNLINVMLGATKVAIESFVSAIEMIASGTASLDKVLKERENL